MNICPMCGKEFDKGRVEKYLNEILGNGVAKQIWDDMRVKYKADELCDSCCISVNYQEDK